MRKTLLIGVVIVIAHKPNAVAYAVAIAPVPDVAESEAANPSAQWGRLLHHKAFLQAQPIIFVVIIARLRYRILHSEACQSCGNFRLRLERGQELPSTSCVKVQATVDAVVE